MQLFHPVENCSFIILVPHRCRAADRQPEPGLLPRLLIPSCRSCRRALESFRSAACAHLCVHSHLPGRRPPCWAQLASRQLCMLSEHYVYTRRPPCIWSWLLSARSANGFVIQRNPWKHSPDDVEATRELYIDPCAIILICFFTRIILVGWLYLAGWQWQRVLNQRFGSIYKIIK
jgi:hypothetical protein